MTDIPDAVLDLSDAIVDQAEESGGSLLTPLVIFAVGLSLGGFAGYFLSKRALEKKYDEMLDAEIKKTVESISDAKLRSGEEMTVRNAERTPTPQKKTLEELKAELGYSSEDADDPAAVIVNGQKVVSSVFSEILADEVHEEGKPKVVTAEIFDENESDYDQISLTYYTEDDVLADEGDSAVEDVDGVIGADNLKRFGKNSRDPNVLYIQNDELETLFEIVRVKGSFVRLILGFDEESDDRSHIRKFRNED